MTRRTSILMLAGVVIGVVAAACGSSGGGSDASGSDRPKVRLVTYSAYALPEKAAAAFEKATGASVEVVASDDAGSMLTKALLSAGDPEGDVIFGIDNTLAAQSSGHGLLDPYSPAAASTLPASVKLGGKLDALLTPIDTGDVCVNVDASWYAKKGIAPPTTLEDLTSPTYKDQLVLESPVTSSPGLAFLIGTVSRYGETGWQGYWQKLKDNGVRVRQSWDDAYENDYSVSGGDRPLVLSYASSPPAEVVYSKGKRTEPVSTVMTDSCVSQVEYAGVLSGTKHPELARKLVDFMLGAQWQAELPLSNFVFPVVSSTPLPEVFQKWAVRDENPMTIDPATIGSHRQAWLEQWRSLME